MTTLYDIIEERVPSLEEVRAILNDPDWKGHAIGVTINPPRHENYVNMPSFAQKIILKGLLLDGIRHMIKNYLYTFFIRYESCKDGQMHLHATIYTDYDLPLSPEGLVCDVAKGVIKAGRKNFKQKIKVAGRVKYSYGVQLFKTHRFSFKYKRYKSPYTCIQFMNDNDELNRWLDYMCKQDPADDEVVTESEEDSDTVESESD